MAKRLLYFFLSLTVIACSSSAPEGCPKKNCKDFLSQQAAQVAFEGDKKCFRNLDHDDDDEACEDEFATGGNANPGTGGGGGGTVTPTPSNCPTTSSCGCSGKNKSACGGACCKWTVGSGCGCK